MSEKIDVLAVMADTACCLAGPAAEQLDAARAAVAKALEAAKKLAANDFTFTSGTAFADAQALRTALDHCGVQP